MTKAENIDFVAILAASPGRARRFTQDWAVFDGIWAGNPVTEPVMLVNSVLNGYRILTKLIECPQTVLYQGVNENNLHEVVIKMLLPPFASKRDLVRQLRREAATKGKFSHPSIIKGRGFFCKPVRHHFVMDYFPSKSMRFRMMDENDQIVRTYRKKIMIEAGEALGVRAQAGDCAPGHQAGKYPGQQRRRRRS